jgi:hypothetical protein
MSPGLKLSDYFWRCCRRSKVTPVFPHFQNVTADESLPGDSSLPYSRVLASYLPTPTNPDSRFQLCSRPTVSRRFPIPASFQLFLACYADRTTETLLKRDKMNRGDRLQRMAETRPPPSRRRAEFLARCVSNDWANTRSVEVMYSIVDTWLVVPLGICRGKYEQSYIAAVSALKSDLAQCNM